MPITTDLSTSIGDVRFLIGDDVWEAGVLPSGLNFSDAQVQRELNAVGGNVTAAAARLCRNLARRWAVVPQSFTADGLSVNRGEMVKKWQELAETLTNEVMGGSFGTVTLDRRDAFSVVAEQGGSDLLRESDTTYTE